jgi:hypothetical protein
MQKNEIACAIEATMLSQHLEVRDVDKPRAAAVALFDEPLQLAHGDLRHRVQSSARDDARDYCIPCARLSVFASKVAEAPRCQGAQMQRPAPPR